MARLHLVRELNVFSEGLAMHSETLAHSCFLLHRLLSELKSKIITENSTACCLATYTRKPHYIRSHEGHVHAHAHPHTQHSYLEPNIKKLNNLFSTHRKINYCIITRSMAKLTPILKSF